MTLRHFDDIVNLEIKPAFKESSDYTTEITVGDLHSNASKFLYILVKHGFLNPTQDQYNELIRLYKQKPSTKETFERFSSCLKAIPVEHRNITLRLIGDELADRGENDYFILKIYQKLSEEKIPMITLFSNHTAVFFEAYTQNHLAKEGLTINKKYTPSLTNLSTSIEHQAVDFEEVKAMIETHYKKTLRLIDYSLDTKKNAITLYTHAPIGTETLPLLAARFHVPYDDTTPQALAQTIESINTAFGLHVKNNTLSTLYHGGQFDEIDKGPPSQDTAVLYTIWNKNYTKLKRPQHHQDYAIHFVHGHDPHDPDPSIHIKSLDNQLGKCEKNHIGKYEALLSDEKKPRHDIVSSPPYFTFTVLSFGFFLLAKYSRTFFIQNLSFFSMPVEKSIMDPIKKVFNFSP
ncbi:MAG: Dot/Icm T4SS effector Wip [Legionellaceae bacterium]